MTVTTTVAKLTRRLAHGAVAGALCLLVSVAPLRAQTVDQDGPTLPGFEIQRTDRDYPRSILLPGVHAHGPELPAVSPTVFLGRSALMLETLHDGVSLADHAAAWPVRQPLDTLYAPESAAKLRRFVTCLQLGVDADRLRPAFHFVVILAALTPPAAISCASILGPSAETVATSSSSPTGGDLRLVQIAQQHRLAIVGAETRSEQLAAIAAAPDTAFARVTTLLLDDPSMPQGMSAEAISRERSELILRGDFDELRRRALDPLPFSDADRVALTTYMVDFRNELIARRIAELASQRSSVIAIGAAHAGGELGVVERLRRMGMRVTPVRVPAMYLP